MAEGYQALSAKETETLRLLLGGHDAKSMAGQLGLSVHTVNERLRDARRKLSVSSSKAAARILRETEGTIPQMLGDKLSGDASPAPSGQTLGPGSAQLPRADGPVAIDFSPTAATIGSFSRFYDLGLVSDHSAGFLASNGWQRRNGAACLSWRAEQWPRLFQPAYGAIPQR